MDTRLTPHPDLRLLAECPRSDSNPHRYLDRVTHAAARAERSGLDGLLVRSENRLVDPWVVAQAILASTTHLRPVVTVQPLDLHPYAAARKVASLFALFGRAPHLNFVAGGNRSDLLALGDRTRHGDRYRRLIEFARLLRELLSSRESVEWDGEFYQLHRPTFPDRIPRAYLPTFFAPSSSDAARAAAQSIGAIGFGHAAMNLDAHRVQGLRIGIICRARAEEAWEVARARFPRDHSSSLTHRLEMEWSDSTWQRELHADGVTHESGLWLEPFASRRSQCAYLVGDYAGVGRSLAKYVTHGVRWLCLDTQDPSDLEHTREALQRGWRRGTTPLAEAIAVAQPVQVSPA